MSDEKGLLSAVETLGDLPGGTEHILFVDDEEAITQIETMTLELIGYNVTPANSGAAALEIFGLHPDAFDLVITDLAMPVMNGTELVRELLKIRNTLPVILCTGYHLDHDAAECREPGVRACLVKPVSRRQLAETVRRVLDGL